MGTLSNRISILLFVSFLLCKSAALGQQIDRIDGYGGYKFGMTLKEADTVREDDSVVECTYVEVYKCIERKGNFFGEEGTIVVQIDEKTRLVDQIVIQFDRTHSKQKDACKAVLNAIFPQLLKIYKAEDTWIEKKTAVWHFPSGGSVSFSNLCVNHNVGTVSVTYSETEGSSRLSSNGHK